MTDVTSATSAPTMNTPCSMTADTGSEGGLQGQLPGAAVFSVDEAKNATNPLQYVPVVGTIYRLITGESIPAPLSILGSVASGAAFGGPVGVMGSVALNFIQELIQLGPDTSRPAAPLGMQGGGSESGVQMAMPGDVAPPGSYTTLATVLPDFLGGGNTAFAGGAPAPGPVRQALAAYGQAAEVTWSA